jgi:hypothetical protein
MNTKKFGKLRFVVYKEKNQFVGVCLELDEIVIENSIEKAANRIFEASKGYVETVIKENLSDELLNQRAPIKYYIKYYTSKIKRDMSKTFETPVIKGVFKFAI